MWIRLSTQRIIKTNTGDETLVMDINGDKGLIKWVYWSDGFDQVKRCFKVIPPLKVNKGDKCMFNMEEGIIYAKRGAMTRKSKLVPYKETINVNTK